MPKFDLRLTTNADIAELNRLYANLTGRPRSLGAYHWEWRSGPAGPGMSWVITEAASGRICAHHGLVPVPLTIAGRAITGARTENTMIDPVYRGRFPYHAYEAICLKQARERFSVIFTTAGRGAPGAVRQRLGYRLIGHWRTYTVAAGASYLARRLLGTWGDLAGRRGPPEPIRLIETTDPERVAALWAQAARSHGLAADRNRGHVAWRLGRHAYHRYRQFIWTDGRRDGGFLAYHEVPGPRGTIECLIEDIFTVDNQVQSLRVLLAAAARHVADRPARLSARILDQDTPLRTALHRHQPAIARIRGPAAGAPFWAWTATPMEETRWEMTRFVAQGILGTGHESSQGTI